MLYSNQAANVPPGWSDEAAQYQIISGRIKTRSLEAHIVDHCNLRCAQCCSLSPYHVKWFESVVNLKRDLALARAVLQPTYFKLVGGEPLMHPNLVECLEAVRESGIAEIVSLTTNALLIKKTPQAIWELLDHMTISIYPDPPLPDEHRELILELAAKHGVILNWKKQDNFQNMTTHIPREDAAETSGIFHECWLRHRCHIIRDETFYMCTRPPHFIRYYKDEELKADGLSLLPRESLLSEIWDYLHRIEPIEACKRCLGSAGAQFSHRQLSRAEVAARVLG